MSISSVTSATHAQHTRHDDLAHNLNAIGSALKTGNLANAQSALSTFQQTLQGLQPGAQTPPTQPFGKNNQANSDYQSLTTDLQVGDMAGAQRAFASLQHDITTGPANLPSQPAAAGNSNGNLNTVA